MKKTCNVRWVPVVMISMLWMLACVEPFDLKLNLTQTLIAVDGNLTDQPDLSYVKIRKFTPSSSSASSGTFSNVNNAQVWVEVNGSERVRVYHTMQGNYSFPKGFKAEEGKSYQLIFRLAEGKEYQSDVQKIKKVTPIKKIYQRHVDGGIPVRDITAEGHKIFIDLDDPPGKGDAYYWNWTLYEKRDFCMSCVGGRYERGGSGAMGSCVRLGPPGPDEETLDYYCDVPCWEVIPSQKLVAQNDAFIDGKSLIGKEIAEIPYYTRYGAVLEIKQHAVTDQAYKYIKLLIDQNQNSGSLADTPSTALVGNIRSVEDPREIIGGYFFVSSVYVTHYFMTREDMGRPGRPIGFESRLPNPEESNEPGRPPLAPCIESLTRTNIQPPNWKNG
jgi:hypothetical protein